MVWVYDQTESLLVSILMHASLMASLTALVPAKLSGVTLLTWILSWAGVLWIVIIAVARVSGRNLSQQPLQKRAA
jgi:hypothetical protein